ncbi:MAG: hypothetical protein ACOYIG_05235 [Acetivibrionales bacterium]|jgi:pimeloyl-ACP methyl ester carboxylesterase|nr:hypothetical protein [Clostridiaceae bacterium]
MKSEKRFDANKTGIFIIPNSSHQPMIDYPQRFLEILISDVLPIIKEYD